MKEQEWGVVEASRLSPLEGEMWQDATSTFSYFDPDAEVSKTHGVFLPHWRQDGVIYFVTFRLADALPQAKLEAIREEKKIWRRYNPEPLSQKQKRDYSIRFTARVQGWLDSGYGSVFLRDPRAKRIVEDALRFFDEIRYRLDEYVIAGNHVHVLVAPIGDQKLGDIMHSWKSFTAKMILKLPASKAVSTGPIIWQQESWDHIVRSGASLNKFREYIRAHRG